mmetsp:Transcript_8934/g.29523  ORF Transcript_8934/g.29523 Transcript_8934/m.29523 type:complete len:236 (+) Transcript_8934:526-1233(+)
MSSKVTTPAVPPYSSTTIAMCSRRRRISSKTFHATIVSGTKYVGSQQDSTRDALSDAGSLTSSKSFFALTTPIMLSISSSYTGMRVCPVASTRCSSDSIVSRRSKARTSTRGCMTSATRVCCKSSTPSIIVPSIDSMPPEIDAPVMIRRSSSCVTAPASTDLKPKRRKTRFDAAANCVPTGPSTTVRALMGTIMNRATFSALFTPSAFGRSSPRKSVSAVSSVVAYASRRADPEQ